MKETCTLCGKPIEYRAAYRVLPGGLVAHPLCAERAKEAPPATGATKHDTDKVPLDLLPVRPLVEIAEILQFGAKKYAAYNWCKGLSADRLYGAMLRHLFAWWSGEDTDQESGLPHLAHAGCCLMFLMDLRHTHPDLDDRPKGQIAPAFEAPPKRAYTPDEADTLLRPRPTLEQLMDLARNGVLVDRHETLLPGERIEGL